MSHRFGSVRLVLGGLSASEAARRRGDSPRAVANWVRRFKRRGAKGLGEAPHPGRPPTITPARASILRAHVASLRAQAVLVSGRVLADYIKRSFGVALTRQQARRILNRLDTQD